MAVARSMVTLETAELKAVRRLLARYGLALSLCVRKATIPGSYWGPPEAGLIGSRVFARTDTPLHSVLHEACHYVCMTPERRSRLHTNAGGDFDEENCVCFMQILLADFVPRYGRHRIMNEMDAWGYSFRLGSASAWFAHDATDARDRLRRWRMIDERGRPAWRLRGAPDTGRAEVSVV